MTIQSRLTAGMVSILANAGKPIHVRYFSEIPGSVWDDEVTLTELTGSTVWTSGLVFPLNTKHGSEDVVLVEQGKLSMEDQKLFTNGSLNYTGTGSNLSVIISMTGSPVGLDNYTLINDGAVVYEVEGVEIYKKAYIRKLTNGSLIGQ